MDFFLPFGEHIIRDLLFFFCPPFLYPTSPSRHVHIFAIEFLISVIPTLIHHGF